MKHLFIICLLQNTVYSHTWPSFVSPETNQIARQISDAFQHVRRLNKAFMAD